MYREIKRTEIIVHRKFKRYTFVKWSYLWKGREVSVAFQKLRSLIRHPDGFFYLVDVDHLTLKSYIEGFRLTIKPSDFKTNLRQNIVVGSSIERWVLIIILCNIELYYKKAIKRQPRKEDSNDEIICVFSTYAHNFSYKYIYEYI